MQRYSAALEERGRLMQQLDGARQQQTELEDIRLQLRQRKAQLQQLAHQVEEAIRSSGVAELPSHEVGLAILGPLRELDEVAYLRFASVYRAYSSVEDFEKEIAGLRAAREIPGDGERLDVECGG